MSAVFLSTIFSPHLDKILIREKEKNRYYKSNLTFFLDVFRISKLSIYLLISVSYERYGTEDTNNMQAGL